MDLPKITIFVSSPGDVEHERRITQRILDQLANEFSAVARIEPFFYEHEPLLAHDTPQAQINAVIRPSETDIVVCILWSRLGSRLPRQFTRPDGSPYNSGTEYEVEDALEARKQRQAEHGELPRPDLLVYRKTARVSFDKDPRAARSQSEQLQLLYEFLERLCHDKADGTLLATTNLFENEAEFESLLEEHLRKLIERRLKKLGVPFENREPQARPTWIEGSPFRGLAVFEFEHQAVFFGRTRAVSDVLRNLKQQAADGRAFLLILGGSGSGKSSLVRAGIVPALVHPGVVEGVGLWRRALVRPSERSGDLFDGLAAMLLCLEALPELASDGTSSAQLAQLLRANPEAVTYLVKGALSQAASHLQKADESPIQPSARLVLVLDQLEELFTADDLSTAHWEAYFRAVRALAASGHTWVIATLRSDFYERVSAIPALVELKSDLGQYDLQLANTSEIAQLIRRPALAAGLRFEEDPATGDRLDDLLRDDASTNRDCLPLLEFSLEELYRRRVGNLLTLDAYRQLGGMRGALARRADEVFQGLPKEAQSALPEVFRQLVAIGDDDGESPLRKQCPQYLFQADAKQLVDNLIDARLLTAKQTASQLSVVEVAHEALVTHWQPLVEWFQQDRRLLRIRARVAAATATWRQGNRQRGFLLAHGGPLEEARQLVAESFYLSPEEQAFIGESERHARRGRLFKRLAAAAIVALTLVAVVGVGIEIYQRRAREEQRMQSLWGRYVSQIAAAQSDWESNDIAQAWDRLQECPPELRGWEFRYLVTLLAKGQTTLCGHRGKVSSVAVSRDGKLIASASWDKTLKLWNAADGREVRSIAGSEAPIYCVSISPDGRAIAGGGPEGIIRLWEVESGHEKIKLDLGATVSAVAFSPNGKLLASGDYQNQIKFWDAVTGVPVGEFSGKSRILSLAFSPDGRRIVSGSADAVVRVWDVERRQEFKTFSGHSAAVTSVAFKPDGQSVASGSADKTVRVWNLASDHSTLTLNAKAVVTAVAFSPNGERLVTGDWNNTVKVWAAGASDQEPQVFKGHIGHVTSVVFSPDGEHLVSGSDDRSIKIWDVASARQPFTLIGPQAGVTSVAFSPHATHLAGATKDGTTCLWDDGANAASRPRILKEPTPGSSVNSLAFAPDDKWVVTGYSDGTIAAWAVRTGRMIQSLKGHENGVNSVAVSPDGRWIVTGGSDNAVKVWDAATWRTVLILDGHTSPVSSVAFSPDSKVVASGSLDKTAKLWNATSGRRIADFGDATLAINCLAFSPDGRRVIGGSDDHNVHIWDVASRHEVKTLVGHTAPVNCVAFTPDGTRIASADNDGRIKIWDPAGGEQILTLKAHSLAVASVAFSPDGLRLASGSQDRTVKLWDGSQADGEYRARCD
jgi:WD40 repeat protein